MSSVSFANPWILVVLPVIPLALAVWWRGTARARERARSLSRTGSARPPYAAACLFSLAAVAAVASAAQPRWGTRESEVPRTGADLVVVIAISRIQTYGTNVSAAGGGVSVTPGGCADGRPR